MCFAICPAMQTRAILAATLVAHVACTTAPAPDPGDIEDGIAVPQGKEDDFLSLSAYEYVLEGRTSVTVEPDVVAQGQEAVDARVRELIGLKQIAVAWFITQYLVSKESEDPNADYGGFGGMAKAGDYRDLDVTPVGDGVYEFTVRQTIAGERNLISVLPITSESGGRAYFDLAVGKPSNSEMARLETNYEWYRSAPWSSWDPSKVADDEKEVINFAIERDHDSTDAWFDYNSMFEDGVVDIDIFFGWDYHDDYHIKHARDLFNWLKNDRGFTPPTGSFDQLDRTSGPFTRTIDANGREIRVEVRLYYGKTGTDTDPDTDAGGRQLEADARASLATRDVFIYSGHSGPFYGFALANCRKTLEGDLDDSEMSSLDLPAKYQIVFAEGCDTYGIGEALRSNPNKPDGTNLDVITTTSFSNAATPASAEDFISRLIERDSHGRHRPRTIKSLLSDLDGNSYWFHTMYGIHGIDDDPALHPYANTEALCQSCSANAECGGVGNMCIGIGQSSGKHCAAACTDDRGCPDGYTCAAVASSSAGGIYGHACVPQSWTCE